MRHPPPIRVIALAALLRLGVAGLLAALAWALYARPDLSRDQALALVVGVNLVAAAAILGFGLAAGRGE